MPFCVSEQVDNEQKIILLEDVSTGTKAQVYAFGALLNMFSIIHKEAEKNIIKGFQNPDDAIQNITPSFQSAKLSPFVCRLKEGQYTFANTKHKIEKYYYCREALHGLIFDAVFSVVEASETDESAFVILSYDYNKNDPGFPFFYHIEITYQLCSNNNLSVTTKLTNFSPEPIPVADGWHPYFSFGKKVDDLTLFINTKAMIEFDKRLLPTGKTLPFHQFLYPQKIGDASLDNSFVLQQDGSGAACIVSDQEEGLQLSIHPDESYPFLQVFTPDYRNSIAIENISSLPDAFNNNIGLIVLNQSESKTFATRFVITLLSPS